MEETAETMEGAMSDPSNNGAKFTTREEWLRAGVQAMRPWIEAEGHDMPGVLVSVGFPKGRHGSGKAVGQCWAAACDEQGLRHIFVSPELKEESRILDVLLHELVHAALPDKVGHKGPFKQLATAVGLEGKMTATVAGAALAARLDDIIEDLGPMPHSKLTPGERAAKQSTRLVKVECPECGHLVRDTRKWIEEVGPTICPCSGVQMVPEAPEEE